MPALTNLQYFEFDSTQQTLVSDLQDKITASASWTKINSAAALVPITVTIAAGAVTLTAASGAWATAGIGIGSVIRIGVKGAADCEYRTVTATTATTVTIAATTYAHNSGTNVYDGHEVFKATTTRGADMIVDLMDAHTVVTNQFLNMAVYKAHTGAMGGGTDRSGRWLYWRATAAVAASNVIHCIVSVSKEHLFISLEGPRFSETNPESATLGSARNYFFIGDVVPYFVGDTIPCAFAGGQMVAAAAASFPTSLFGGVSRDAANANSWVQARLQTPCTPQNGGPTAAFNVQRLATGDGNWYLDPYKVVEDVAGERGRLANFFFAGYVNPDYPDGVVPAPPLGSKVTYSSQNYKILVMNKTGTSISTYSQFGANVNASNNGVGIAVAVPCT